MNHKNNMPQNLFDALAQYDLEGMVCLYALHTRNALQSVFHLNKDVRYQSLWDMRPDDASSKDINSFEQSLTRAIQEMDLIVSNRTNVASAHAATSTSSPTTNPTTVNTHANVASFRTHTQPFESSSNRGPNTNLFPFFPTLLDEPRFMPSPVSMNMPNASHRSRLRRMRSNSPTTNNKNPTDAAQATSRNTYIYEQEVEYCLHERLRTLTNARPFPTLVVYKDGKTPTKPGGNIDDDMQNVHSNSNVISHAGTSTDENTEDVPIFDGAVANATPPGMQGSGGGSGTILHLACALDSPFALILLLLMGGDAGTRHTAFRRLMVHEAACSNSPHCLKLLLDLGELYHEESQRKEKNDPMDIDVTMNSNLDVNAASFLAGGKEQTNTRYGDLLKQKGKKNHLKNIPTIPNNTNPALRTACLLRTALSLARRIQNGEIEDFVAAENLLSQYPLSKTNQRFLAISCYAGSNDINTTDGHGNTALHWAAFKNALDCASILLSYNTNPNAVAKNSGWTPLHDAAYSDSTETLALLLSHGANVNVRAYSGASPLCFAAQEDAPNATRLLLNAGADATVRCCDDQIQSGYPSNSNSDGNGVRISHHLHANRFSGYTPLHYCAHYNAHHAVRVILEHHTRLIEPNNDTLLEIPDLNDKLPIHVAAARGSSDVLRDLLHYGARVETGRPRTCSMSTQNDDQSNSSLGSAGIAESTMVHQHSGSFTSNIGDVADTPQAASGDTHMDEGASGSGDGDVSSPRRASQRGTVVTPVSSPILRSMIPSEPIESPKPWNCISQRSIDECRTLIAEAESSWAPERHSLFHPRDRLAVIELLRVGKRLEQAGTGIFIDLWPLVLSFCGRGWFEPERSERHQQHHHDGSIFLPQDL